MIVYYFNRLTSCTGHQYLLTVVRIRCHGLKGISLRFNQTGANRNGFKYIKSSWIVFVYSLAWAIRVWLTRLLMLLTVRHRLVNVGTPMYCDTALKYYLFVLPTGYFFSRVYKCINNSFYSIKTAFNYLYN